jgi:hypothetical protein
MKYPLEGATMALESIVDEIVVVDSTKTEDGTKSLLEALKRKFENSGPNKSFKIIDLSQDIKPNDISWAIYEDGYKKAIARSHCTGDYCISFDLDEIFVGSRQQVEDMINKAGLNKDNPIMALPVVEPWGSSGKVRVDVNPWKERISINDPNITHGVPASHRKYVNGVLHAHHGSDSCNMIYKDTGKVIPITNFVKPEVDNIRRMAVYNKDYIPAYEQWFNKITDKMPYVFHVSWWSVYNKMLNYKLHWNDFWKNMYNEERPEGYNPFFNKPFDQVTNEEMKTLASQIENEISGHIFHSPWESGITQSTNGIKINKPIPEIVKCWCEQNKTY